MEPNAKLDLEFKRKKSGETYVSRQYFKLPLQIFPPNYLDMDGTAFLYLLNPSSGMLEGDLFDMSFELKQNASVVITTPASNKIYKSKCKKSRQVVTVKVKSGCVLEYIPMHNMPYADSMFHQEGRYEIEKGGILFTWDTVMPGRIENGESFDFTSYHSDISVFYDEELIIREGMRLVPAKMNAHNVSVLDHFSIFQTAYLIGEYIPDSILERLRQYFSTEKEIYAGVSKPDEHALTIKVLYSNTLHVEQIQWNIWNIVRSEMIGKPAFTIRKY